MTTRKPRKDARKCIETELGKELQCSQCREFFPADTTFFYAEKRSPWGLHSWCKCCYEDHPNTIKKRKRWQLRQQLQTLFKQRQAQQEKLCQA